MSRPTCRDWLVTFTPRWAGLRSDLDMDTKDFETRRKIDVPPLLLWGATGCVGRNRDPGADEI